MRDLRGKEIPAPVLYAGAVERTSFAEKDEQKGYMTIDIEPNEIPQWQFHRLPTRPMIALELDVTNMSGTPFVSWLRKKIEKIPSDSIVKLKLHGRLYNEILEVIRAASLRSIVPNTMNLTIKYPTRPTYHSTD